MLLRPIRTLIIIGLAFMAGYLYARHQTVEACTTHGGTMRGQICEAI